MNRLRHFLRVVAICIVAPAAAAAAADASPIRSIHAAGHGSVKASPDRARIAVSVTTHGATARDASESNARTSKDVLAKLRAAIAPPGEVSTAGYDLAPQYDYSQANGTVARSPKLVGYNATNRFSIVSADLAGVGAIIDSAVAAGANQVDSIGFFVADEEAARRQALLEAGRKARAEAETIAQSLGVHLGSVMDASSSTTPAPMPMMSRAVAMDAIAQPTEVVPGSVEIGADVTVTFAIADVAPAE